MVLITFKNNSIQFELQVNNQSYIHQIKEQLTYLNNSMIKLEAIQDSLQDLNDKGPLKPEELRGIPYGQPSIDSLTLVIDQKRKSLLEKFVNQPICQNYKQDENNFRTGVLLDKDLKNKMQEFINQLKIDINNLKQDQQYIDNDDNDDNDNDNDNISSLNFIIKQNKIQEIIQHSEAILQICFPGLSNLYEWEPIIMLLQNSDLQTENFLILEENDFWFANKILESDQKLIQYVKNNKSKVVLKVNRKNHGMPVKEPPITEEQQKNMMKFYYKRQEELKELEEQNEDHYLNREWANNKNLKNQLQGIGEIGFKMRKL